LTNKLLNIILIIIIPVITLGQSILKENLTPESFPIFDKYIRTYAPSDSAFNVVLWIAGRNSNTSRNIVVREVLKAYSGLFPKKRDIFKEKIHNAEILMLSETATPDLFFLFEQYAKDSADSENGYLALQRVADHHINHSNFDSASALYRKFIPLYTNLKGKLEGTIEILERAAEGLIVHNLGSAINSSSAEWDPNPTPDGKYLYMTADNKPGGFGGEDIWVSEFANGKWQTANNIGGGINGSNNETIDNVSVDGNTILLSGNFEGTFGNFDIYIVNRTDRGWGPLEHLPYPINTKYHDEGANLTSDGQAILFTSDRPGGIGPYVPRGFYYHGTQNGNMDIYVCIKTDSGWSKPINLSTTINTPFAERSPYLHPDGKTLYFSSDGHPGLGRMDVYKSVRLKDDSWTEWSEPVNLGKEINTILDDWGYKISAKGDSAFFAGQWRTNGYGDWDLYSVTLPESARPAAVISISGRVLDSDGKPLSAEIKWEDLSTGLPIGTLKSNPEDGTYIIILPLGKNYGYYAEKAGYFSASDNLDLRDPKSLKDINRDIRMISMNDLTEKQVKLRINNVFFDFDQYTLKSESFPELDRLIKLLKDNNQRKIHLEGHTDNEGTDEYNLELSRKRAESVRDYLVRKGTAKERISILGYGATMPVTSNDTEEGRATNRRVEMWFVR
jgi:outer membrane protein OmpA-like peptidoglycan-associated protein